MGEIPEKQLAGTRSFYVCLKDGSQCPQVDLGNFMNNAVRNFQAPFLLRFVTPKELILNEANQKHCAT